jgi:putative aldouronate transport system substrate-binding protein
MKNHMKSWFALLMCLTLVFTMLAACSGNNGTNEGSEATENESSENEASENEKKEEPANNSDGTYSDVIDIDWYVNLSWWKWPGDYGKDKASQFIREKFGLNINFLTPAGDGAEKMSTMIASGSLPDIITTESWLDYKTKLAKGGYLVSMNELMEKHAPDFKKQVYEDVFNWYKEADGKTYGLPNFAYSRFAMKPGQKLEPNGAFTLRKDIYDQLGRPDISSPDKFMAVLERVKNEVKTYDGKPLVPLQLYEFSANGNTSLLWLSQNFSVPYEDKEGNWAHQVSHPKYFQVLKFLNEAYRKGLISKDNFSDKRDQINEKVASGRVFAMFTAPQDFGGQYRTLFEADNKAQYEAFVLPNYDQDAPYVQDLRGFGWLYTMVNKDAKAQDRITKLFQFLTSKEGQYFAHFGWEGETYTVGADGRVSWTEEYQKLMDANEAAPKYGIGFNLLMDWLTVKDIVPQTDKPADVYLRNIKKPVVDHSYDFSGASLKHDPEDPRKDEMGEINNRINLYWAEQVVKIIVADSEEKARSLYDNAVQRINEMGLDKLKEYNNEGFQNSKKALGIERSWPGNLK